jgi:hypothetical protein
MGFIKFWKKEVMLPHPVYSPPAPLAYIIQPEALPPSEVYLMVITTKIHVNRMARWLEGEA